VQKSKGKSFPVKFLIGRIFLCAWLLAVSNALAGHCGNPIIWEHKQSLPNGVSARIANSSITNCDAEAYYDSLAVQEKRTEHFHVFYVLQGPHATTEAYIDTLLVDLEKAWNFFILKLGYQKPVSATKTWHYQKTPAMGLMPVEVLDLTLIRDNHLVYQGFCEGCMGSTFLPDDEYEHASEIFLDNDFYYSTSTSALQSSEFNSSCTYPEADKAISNIFSGKNYALELFDGIRLTVFHEFYHALQFAYVTFFDSYWFEASATAFEEISAPDINDYWQNVPILFASTGTPFHRVSSPYSLSLWGLYNAKEFGDAFDKKIWERFSKNSEKTFEAIFAEELGSQNLNPDSAFHDFATRLFFSGNRASEVDSTWYITEDAPFWNSSPTLFSATTSHIELEAPTFAYYRLKLDSLPDLSLFQGKASVVTFGKKQKTEVNALDSATFTSLASQIETSENAILVLSRLRDSSTTVIANDTLPMRSYPNPWRGETPLCFAGLPEKKKFIEIRTRVGKLVKRYDYTSSHFCIDSDEIKKHLSPGLYYFRAGSRNTMKPFLVIF